MDMNIAKIQQTSKSTKRDERIGIVGAMKALTKLSNEVLGKENLEKHNISEELILDALIAKFSSSVLKKLVKKLFEKPANKEHAKELMTWIFAEVGLSTSSLSNAEVAAQDALGNLAAGKAPKSVVGQNPGTSAAKKKTQPNSQTPGASSGGGDQPSSLLPASGGRKFSCRTPGPPRYSDLQKIVGGKKLLVAEGTPSGSTSAVTPVPYEVPTPAGANSYVCHLHRTTNKRKASEDPTNLLTTPDAKRRFRSKSRALHQNIDLQNNRSRPPKGEKTDKGVPRIQPQSKFSFVDAKFMCAALREMKCLRCPKCERELQIHPNTLHHSLQLKLVCPATRLTSLDITEATQKKLIEKGLSPSQVIADCKAIHGELQTCDYQCVISCSRQMKKDSHRAKALLSCGNKENEAVYNSFTEADFAVLIGAHLGMLSHKVYEEVYGGCTLSQRTFPPPVFYALSPLMYDEDGAYAGFFSQAKVLKLIARNIPKWDCTRQDPKWKLVGKYLGMDTTFSQRRHANFSLSLLLCSESGLAFDFECLGRVESGLDASKLEAKASLNLVDRAVADLSEKKGPRFKGICTDGHVENAEMMKKRFFEFNKKNCVKGRFVGPTKCSLEIDECVSRYVNKNADLCGVHAESVLSFAGTYAVEVNGRLKTFKRDEILEFMLPPEDFPTEGSVVHITKSVNSVVKHLLDLWHKRNSVRRALETKLEYLDANVSQFHRGLCSRHLQEALTDVVKAEDQRDVFARWITCFHDLGSIFDEQASEDDQKEGRSLNRVTPKLIQACEELLFGEDLRLAEIVQKSRTDFEKWRVGCKCDEQCKCGKYKHEVPYVKKLRQKKKRRGRPLTGLLDERTILQLLFKEAASSYPESCNSFIHKFIHKRRDFKKSYKGRVAYLLLIWNCYRLSQVAPDLYDKQGGLNCESPLYKELIKLPEVTPALLESVLTVSGVQRTLFGHLQRDVDNSPLFHEEYEFLNRYSMSHAQANDQN